MKENEVERKTFGQARIEFNFSIRIRNRLVSLDVNVAVSHTHTYTEIPSTLCVLLCA